MAIPLINAFIRLRPDTTNFESDARRQIGNIEIPVKLNPEINSAALKAVTNAIKAELAKVSNFAVRPTLDNSAWRTEIRFWERTNLRPRSFFVRPVLDPSRFRAGQVADQTFQVRPNLNLSTWIPQWRLFSAVYLHPIHQINVHVNLDPNALRALTGPAMRSAGRQGGTAFSGSFLEVMGRVFKTQLAKILLAALSAAPALLNLLPLIGELVTLSGALGAALPAAITAALVPAIALKLAFSGVGDAFKEAFSGTDPEKLAEALAKLAPAARSFVLEVRSFKPLLTELQQSVQQAFFQPLMGGFRSLISSGLLDQVRSQFSSIAATAGQTARNMLEVVRAGVQSGQVWNILGGARVIFERIAAVLPGLVKTFLTLTEHGMKFADALFGGVAGGLERFNKLVADAAADGRLDQLFQDGLEILKQLGSVLSNIGSIFKSVFSGITAGAGGVLGPMSALLETVAEFLKTVEAQDALKLLGETLRALGNAVQEILVPLLPVVAQLAKILGSVLSQAVLDLAPALGAFATSLAKILTMIITTGEPILRVLVGVLSDFLVKALAAVTKHMDTMMPVLEDLLAELGPAMIPVVEALGNALIELVPIIPEITRAMVALIPVVQALTPVLVFMAQLSTNSLNALAAVIRNVVVPVVRFFVDALINMVEWVRSIVAEVTQRWQTFATWFRTNVWETWLGPTVNLIIGAFNRFRDNVTGVLNAVLSVASAWWNGLRNTIFNPLINFVTTTLPSAFSRAADMIGAAFGRVTGFVRNVVNGTITVINGVINAFNTVARAVGVGTIPTIGQVGAATGGGGGGGTARFTKDGGLVGLAPFVDPQKLAAGGPTFPGSFARLSRPGMITGAGGGRDDRVPLWASAREFVVNAAATRVWRPVLEWINSRGLRGVTSLPQGPEPLGHRRDGGMVAPVAPVYRADGGIIGALTAAWDAITNPAKFVGDRINGLIARIPGAGIMRDVGVGMGKRLVSALIKWITTKFASFGGGTSGPGFPPWPSGPGAQRGDSGVWRSIVALIRATGPLSGSFGNAYRPGDPLWHGSGRAVDWMGFNQDALATFLAARRPLELIHRTNRRDYAYTRGQNRGSFSQGLMEGHRNHIHIAMRHGGAIAQALGSAVRSAVGNAFKAAGLRSYDSGGPWAPGTLGANTSGRWEHVSTGGSMDRVERKLDRLIEAVESVAPAFAREMHGSATSLRVRARTR